MSLHGSLFFLKIASFVLMHKDMAFSSLESPPSPNVYDSICESLCKPWLGIVNVKFNYGIHVVLVIVMLVECIPS